MFSRLRTLVAATATAVTIADPGFAADLPRKAQAQAPLVAPAYDWTGVYVGANLGHGVSNDPSRSVLTLGVPGAFDTFNLSSQGVLGGGQIGYNWQPAPSWLLGIEGDIQATAQTNATACVTFCAPLGLITQASQKLPWFGTLRGRLGWTNGQALYYVTGGWAYGRVTSNYAVQIGPPLDSHSFGETRSGWTIGAGMEAQLGGNWTGKIEYLYVDLGTVTNSFAYTPLPLATYLETSEIHDHIVRAGVNYRFGNGWPATPAPGVLYKAPSALAPIWSGFYLGGNVGYGVARDPNQSIQSVSGVTQFAETFSLAPHGVLGGGQIGYNWRLVPNWVWGIETDFQASGQSDTACVTSCSTDQFTRVTHTLPWFGTVRGRLGWTNGPALFYLTGGWAYGRVETDVSAKVIGFAPDARSFAHTRSGGSVGGGVELALADSWTTKFEYLFIDLGSVTDTLLYTPTGVTSYVETSPIRSHVARIGLNYRFAPDVRTTRY